MPDAESVSLRRGQRPDITQPPRLEGAITWHRFVPHHRLLSYLMAGWRYDCDLGDHHGTYCVLMTWPFEGEPGEPR